VQLDRGRRDNPERKVQGDGVESLGVVLHSDKNDPSGRLSAGGGSASQDDAKRRGHDDFWFRIASRWIYL